VSVGNTGETKWVCPVNAGSKPGGVYLTSIEGSDDSIAGFKTAILSDVPMHGDVEIPEFVLINNVSGKVKVVLQMTAYNRVWFGEKISFVLVESK
jgi:hypothetical protein